MTQEKKRQMIKRLLIGLLAVILVAGSGFYVLYEPAIAAPATMTTLNLNLDNQDKYLSEENYQEEMNTIVDPYLDEFRVQGYFTTQDNANIYYEQYLPDAAKGSIVISHGFTESIEKYKEVIYYYLQEGYSVHILEHRGHGNSVRYVDNLSKVHITDFELFVTDLHQFITEKVVTTKEPNSPLFLYAHSMGGGIGVRYLEEYPDTFTAAVLSSPMIDINLGSCPKKVGTFIANIMHHIGQGQTYVFGQKDFNTVPNLEESCASSDARYDYMFDKKLENELMQTSGGTFSWLKSSLDACNAMTKQENMNKVKTPILMFQSGNDVLVNANGQNKFASNTDNTQLIHVEGAKHELTSAQNEIIIPYMNTILGFYEQYTK